MEEENNISEQKALFAEMLLKTPNEPFKAALAVFPDNTQKALWVANYWVNDPEVIAAQATIIEESGIGDDERYIERKLKEIIDAANTFSDDKIKALDKLMDLKGLSKKPVSNINNNIVLPKAIEIPSYGSFEEWEKVAAPQQSGLLNVSRSRH